MLLPVLVLLAASIHGTVRAEASLEPVGFATVEIAELGRGVIADEAGYYVLANLPAGRYTVRASAIGYRAAEQTVTVGEAAVRLDVRLAPEPVPLSGLHVEAVRGLGTVTGPSGVRLGTAEIRRVPSVAEADVLRAVQILPSVAAVSDFSSALYIRGGAPDQNLFLLDGVPVFNPYHLGGVFSSFNPEAVAMVDLMAGGVPARVGDRLASTVDVRLRDGGRDRLRGSGALGMVSSRATVDGPLPGRGGSFLLSTRRTYGEVFDVSGAASSRGMIPRSMPHGYGDLLAKATHDVGSMGALSGFVFLDREWLSLTEDLQSVAEYDWGWGSRIAGLQYRQPLTASLLSQVRVARSAFRTATTASWLVPDTRLREPTLDGRGEIQDVQAAADLTWYRGRHEIRAGTQTDAYRYDYDVVRTEPAPAGSFEGFVPPFRAADRLRTTAGYVEGDFQLGDALRFRLGGRVLHAEGLGTEWMPRLGAQLALTPRLALALGAGRYAQALHSLRNEESIATNYMAYDLLAVPWELGLATAEDLILGAIWEEGATTLRVDAYTKRMANLALPPLPASADDAMVLAVEDFRAGSGTARGLETIVRHSRAGGSFWLSYALAFTERELDGAVYAPRFHRQHVVDLMAAVPIGQAELSLRTLGASGQPATAGIGLYRGLRHDPRASFDPRTATWLDEEPAMILLGEHNAIRRPGYMRVDVAGRTSFDRMLFGASTTLTPYVQVVNVLDGWIPGVEPEQAPALRIPRQITIGLEWSL